MLSETTFEKLTFPPVYFCQTYIYIIYIQMYGNMRLKSSLANEDSVTFISPAVRTLSPFLHNIIVPGLRTIITLYK